MYEVTSKRFLGIATFQNREFSGIEEFFEACDQEDLKRPSLSPGLPYQEKYFEEGEMVLRMTPRYKAIEMVRHSVILEPWSCMLLDRIQKDGSFAEWVSTSSEGVIEKWCIENLR